MENEQNRTLYCSFCGKSQDEVRKLIAGREVFICDGCVEDCNNVLQANDYITFHEPDFYMFSNFSSFEVVWRGRKGMTSEHLYQAAKFTDEHIIQLVLDAPSPHDAKKIAHEHEDQIRPDWDEEMALQVMEEVCRAKLQQHLLIQEVLRETGVRYIVEDSSEDPFWGWGPDRKGLNHLGRIWMRLRKEQL